MLWKTDHRKMSAFLSGWGDDITWVQTYEEGLSKAVDRY